MTDKLPNMQKNHSAQWISHRGETISPKALARRGLLSAGPGVAWLTLFFAAPLALIAVLSGLTRSEYGGIELNWTWENYTRLLGFGLFGFEPLYPWILGRSIGLGLATASLCAVAGLPLAFFIASLPGRYRPLGLMLVVIPLWTNLLVRTYAWQLMLSPESWLTRGAVFFGFIAEGSFLYPSSTAVYLCMVCDYLPFLVLPLYASVEKIDWHLVEAATDLGASGGRLFRHAILPQIWPGLTTGFILVLLPATGQFVIPDLLGGARTVMLGNLIQQQFGPALDWPFGAAIATFSLVLVAAGLACFFRMTREGEPS